MTLNPRSPLASGKPKLDFNIDTPTGAPAGRVGTHGHGQRSDAVPPLGAAFKAGRFGRLVPELTQPLIPDDAALVELGLAMTEGAGGKPSSDNRNIPAGFTYLGQFIDHDITLDTTSLSEVAQDPSALENFRTPRLDLDSVYGGGPRVQPSLYDRTSPGRAKLLIGLTSDGVFPVKAGLAHDLPRNAQGFALIGDERNDENLLVAQTHLAFLRLHNRMVDRLVDSMPADRLFDAARRATIDLYQAMVLRDFLGKLCDVNDIAAAVAGRRVFRFETFGAFGQPYMPAEFSAAAYRLGHSMVRNAYSHNRFFGPAGPGPGTFDFFFRFTAKSGLIGTPGNPATFPSDWIIDWRRYLDFTLPNEVSTFDGNFTRTIDPYLAEELHLLGVPQAAQGAPRPAPTAASSLAVMNLRRGVKMLLPAAQDLATFMGVPIVPAADIAAAGPDGAVAARHGMHERTPLWYYILKEAELTQGGQRLGPLGSLIVAETFVGLLQGDPQSLLARNPGWRFGQPIPGLVVPGADLAFSFADLVATAAGGRDANLLSPVDDPGNERPPAPPPGG